MTYPMCIFDFGRRHVTDVPHGLQRWFVEEWRLAVDHLDNHNTEGPDIHLLQRDTCIA